MQLDARPSQVYYQWQNSNSSIWRRDPDPFCSAQNLLSGRSDITSSSYRVDNVRGLAFYIYRIRSACLARMLKNWLWMPHSVRTRTRLKSLLCIKLGQIHRRAIRTKLGSAKMTNTQNE